MMGAFRQIIITVTSLFVYRMPETYLYKKSKYKIIYDNLMQKIRTRPNYTIPDRTRPDKIRPDQKKRDQTSQAKPK